MAIARDRACVVESSSTLDGLSECLSSLPLLRDSDAGALASSLAGSVWGLDSRREVTTG